MKNTFAHITRASTLLVASAFLALLSSCEGGPGGGGFLLPGQTWIATDPVQCLTNPWEEDWLSRDSNVYQDYPRAIDSQLAIVRDYYARMGVEIAEAISIAKYNVTCDACSCPRGDALYLRVRDADVDTMLSLGYRLESPWGETPCDPTLEGMYVYTGFDTSGNQVVTGTLHIFGIDSGVVRGTWSFTATGAYGPGSGSGPFEGEVHGDTLALGLNPGWADNNVFLVGRVEKGIYSGKWEWDTFIGPTESGRFTAVKR